PNEAELARETRASIFPYFTFFLPERQQVIGYPIAGLNNDLRLGHRRYNFIWYRVGDAQELRRMCVDERGQQHDYSVPPPLIREALIGQMRDEAQAIMPPQFLDCLAKMRPFFTPIYDLRFLDPATGVRAGGAGGRCRLVRAPAYVGFGMAKAGGHAQTLG